MLLLLADVRAAVAAIDSITEWMHLALDLASVVVIATGGVQAFIGLPAAVCGRRRFTAVRLDFARYLALATSSKSRPTFLRRPSRQAGTNSAFSRRSRPSGLCSTSSFHVRWKTSGRSSRQTTAPARRPQQSARNQLQVG
jgi:hypothetical protein